MFCCGWWLIVDAWCESSYESDHLLRTHTVHLCCSPWDRSCTGCRQVLSLSVCLSFCLSVCLSVCLSLCLSVCESLFHSLSLCLVVFLIQSINLSIGDSFEVAQLSVLLVGPLVMVIQCQGWYRLERICLTRMLWAADDNVANVSAESGDQWCYALMSWR